MAEFGDLSTIHKGRQHKMKTYVLTLSDGFGQPVKEWIVAHFDSLTQKERSVKTHEMPDVLVVTYSTEAEFLEAEISAAIENDN